jgi:hypothetical protein
VVNSQRVAVERITNLKMTGKGWMEQRNPDWGLQKVDNWSRRRTSSINLAGVRK